MKRNIMQKILKTSKVTSDFSYQAEKETCPTCSGSGFLRVEPAGNERWRVGMKQQLQPCTNPDFHKDMRVRQLSAISYMTDSEKQIRLADIQPIDTGKMIILPWSKKPRKESNIEAITLAKDIIANPYDIGLAAIWGPNGSGKTMIAHAITNELTLKAHRVIYMTLSELIAYIKSSYGDVKISTESRYNDLSKSAILIVDEFDFSDSKTSDTNHNLELIQRWFNDRWRVAKDRTAFTLLIGNYPIQNMGLRAVNSRLNDGEFIHNMVVNAAPDYRKRKNQ